MLVHFKNVFSLTSLGLSFERRAYRFSFENYQGIPCSHRQSRQRLMNNLLMVNMNPISKR